MAGVPDVPEGVRGQGRAAGRATGCLRPPGAIETAAVSGYDRTASHLI
jgi:hypothetical protein